jgi:hypothetical protein
MTAAELQADERLRAELAQQDSLLRGMSDGYFMVVKAVSYDLIREKRRGAR